MLFPADLSGSICSANLCLPQGVKEMIECQDVSFSYPASTLPDSESVKAGGALKHISCTIEDGSFVLLCGTSGCGKQHDPVV